MARLWLLLSAFAGFTGVALGAFAAHGLKGRLTPEYLAVFQTGTHYQLIHALALFGVGLLALHMPGRLVNLAGGAFAVGILLFSGSLYLLTLSGIGKLGMITPFGGVAFLIGWLCLGLAAWRLA
ncbi:DUF423 domain-containing protein [Ectopseudomonas oleovorans]|jgi:uncharacterized membrane protein YgdD (TMEM256/DUF423 family)|uniref:DUF423 domain-containing protein n=1 Tax=Ectopseudomonas oleovorans TaxID=301 RepID=A0AB35KWP0_ECTOL|nr:MULTISPECIES: DUF423 domain-containing protein [Pseudomonas]MBQ1559091.1 DUF423 domain-containing protein [Pseudomonas sp.]AXO63402.1 DUF423 domain-containing protein [Pseudomonas sp. phDV1]MCR1825193.1 DUF423 domain-containing protein [Pseudomonas oleovorans]MDG9976795.1 DUF423 domain-containing protein [Pseudomonas oleovorans]MDH0566397.1 DUF423 domain-containing protein [Pseudomonas oleovorans]